MRTIETPLESHTVRENREWSSQVFISPPKATVFVFQRRIWRHASITPQYLRMLLKINDAGRGAL